MNVLRELANFLRQMAGIIFVSQDADPNFSRGVVALWHNGGVDRLRFRNAAGVTFDLDGGAVERRFAIGAGPTAAIDFPLQFGEEVVDVILHKTGAPGGGAGTLQLVNATTGAPISDAMSINVDPGQVIRPTAIDSAQATIAPGGVLRFVRTRVASTDESVIAYVKTLRR